MEIIFNNNDAVERKVLGTITKTYEIVETTTYSLKERQVEMDIILRHEEKPMTKTERYLEIVKKTEEIEINK